MKNATLHEDARPPASWPTTSTRTARDRGVMTSEFASRTDPHGPPPWSLTDLHRVATRTRVNAGSGAEALR